MTFLTRLNPRQLIYMPDMLVAIVALKQYAALNKGEYASTVDTWVDKAKKEWLDHSPIIGMDIDAGPVIMGLSPSGTAFSTGAATFFNDNEVRSNILRTAEILWKYAIIGQQETLRTCKHSPGRRGNHACHAYKRTG